MLAEIKHVRQIPGDAPRRWFEDRDNDLIVWKDEKNRIIGFQLCYGKGRRERALTWEQGKGYTHDVVDDGENNTLYYKSSPILIPGGEFDAVALAEKFTRISKNIDTDIADFVKGHLVRCMQFQADN